MDTRSIWLQVSNNGQDFDRSRRESNKIDYQMIPIVDSTQPTLISSGSTSSLLLFGKYFGTSSGFARCIFNRTISTPALVHSDTLAECNTPDFNGFQGTVMWIEVALYLGSYEYLDGSSEPFVSRTKLAIVSANQVTSIEPSTIQARKSVLLTAQGSNFHDISSTVFLIRYTSYTGESMIHW